MKISKDVLDERSELTQAKGLKTKKRFLPAVRNDKHRKNVISTERSDERSQKKRNKQVNITTMKRYIKPAIEFIEVETAPILKASIYMGGNEEAIKNAEEAQLGKEHRGDWENIWGNM